MLFDMNGVAWLPPRFFPFGFFFLRLPKSIWSELDGLWEFSEFLVTSLRCPSNSSIFSLRSRTIRLRLTGVLSTSFRISLLSAAHP
jgi:hypothetical protein